MIPEKDLNLKYIGEALRRRFWFVVIPFFIISLTVILYCISTPRIFRAQTFILVEPQKVPGEYVTSTVTIDLSSRLRTITQQIKSRTRLEKIIDDYDLYSQIRATSTMTDAVEAFKGDIDVKVRGGNRAFEVSYQGKDPVKVRDVTNIIAHYFIENNLKLREAQAAGTTMFLDRELERLSQILKQKETALRQFKEQYMGVLPENMDQNYRIMAHLQAQLDSINATIQQTKDRRILLESQLNNLRRMEVRLDGFGSPDAGTEDTGLLHSGSPGLFSATDLAALQNKLKNLRSRYSDKHPDVVKTQAAIAKLEKELEMQQPGSTGDRDSEQYGISAGHSLFSLQIEDLSTQIGLIDIEMGKFLEEQKRIEKELKECLQRIESGPKIEQMLVDLRRGYDEVDQRYRAMLEKKFKATLAENLEIAQQAEQFTILDLARLPDKPYKPQTRKILLIGFFLALSGGVALAGLIEYLDPSFFRAKDLESYLEFPLLASIPLIVTEEDRKRIMVRRIASASVVVSMASTLLFALYYLWEMDPMAISASVS